MYEFYDVEGCPVRAPRGWSRDASMRALAFDTDPPRRFPASAVFDRGLRVSEAAFRALVVESRSRARPARREARGGEAR
jgi:hypothetical protein